jgi:hypothetical protein
MACGPSRWSRWRTRLPGFSLLEVTIKTGRTHQIRVHLASQGHAIAGRRQIRRLRAQQSLQRQGLKRMFLHAWRLQFNHPVTGERVQLVAPLPLTFRHFVDHAAQRQFDLIAFDWDGTLFDSTKIIVRCIQRAVDDVGGAVPSDKDAAYVIGWG